IFIDLGADGDILLPQPLQQDNHIDTWRPAADDLQAADLPAERAPVGPLEQDRVADSEPLLALRTIPGAGRSPRPGIRNVSSTVKSRRAILAPFCGRTSRSPSRPTR